MTHPLYKIGPNGNKKSKTKKKRNFEVKDKFFIIIKV